MRRSSAGRHEVERRMPPPRGDDPLGRVFLRLDGIQVMVRQREQRKGGCVIGNFSTALSDTQDGFRRRLAECFDEMAREFKPHLDAAVQQSGAAQHVDTWELARYGHRRGFDHADAHAPG